MANYNRMIRKLQTAIVSTGKLVKVHTRQFYSEDQGRMITMHSVTDAKTKAAKLAAIYRENGMSQSEAMRAAWEKVKQYSKSGVDSVEDDLDGIGDKSKETGEEIGNNLGGELAAGFKKLGSAMAAAFAVDKLIDFGKRAIELGSDLQEVQNVVDVTFSTMSDKVNEFAKAAQKTAGLSETMAKQYACITGRCGGLRGTVRTESVG